jgi:hypothetical protein
VVVIPSRAKRGEESAFLFSAKRNAGSSSAFGGLGMTDTTLPGYNRFMEEKSPFFDKIREVLREIAGDGKWLSPQDEAALRQRLESEVREGRMQPEQVEKALRWVRLVGNVSPEISSTITHEVLNPENPRPPEFGNEPLQPSTASGTRALFWFLLLGGGGLLFYYLSGAR